jgi:hypothetical protein
MSCPWARSDRPEAPSDRPEAPSDVESESDTGEWGPTPGNGVRHLESDAGEWTESEEWAGSRGWAWQMLPATSSDAV